MEIEEMRYLKTVTIPMMVMLLGKIKKGIKNYLTIIPGLPSMREVQKIVLKDT